MKLTSKKNPKESKEETSKKRTYTFEIDKKLNNKKVFLKGWIHDLRDLANIKFLLLRDSEGIIQCTIKKNTEPFKNFHNLSPESVVELEGTIKNASIKSPEVTIKDFEIEVNTLKILNKADPLPIQVIEKGIPTDLSKRLDWRCLDLRKPKNLAIFKIESALIQGMQHYLYTNGFLQVFTPCLMGVASESGSEVFKVDYYDRKAFLRQDPQLHRQLSIISGLEKIYDLGPSWRAELSHTTKHICEHRTCAVELGFIKDETDTMRVEEELIVSAFKKIKEKCQKELELLNIDLKIPETPFPELRFPNIYDILAKQGKDIYGKDLDAEAEKLIWEHIKKKYKSDFYFFNRFPFKIKPFYVMKVDEDPEWARSVDLNYQGLELSSGGQREHRYEKMIEQVNEKRMQLKDVEWFTTFFKYGAPPHGGFAIGIERLTQKMLNLENIREAVLFPRDAERILP